MYFIALHGIKLTCDFVTVVTYYGAYVHYSNVK